MEKVYGIINRTDLRSTHIMSILENTIESLEKKESVLYHAIGGDVKVSRSTTTGTESVYIIEKV